MLKVQERALNVTKTLFPERQQHTGEQHQSLWTS